MSDITPEQSAEWAIRHATPGAEVTIDCPSPEYANAATDHIYAMSNPTMSAPSDKATIIILGSALIRLNH